MTSTPRPALSENTRKLASVGGHKHIIQRPTITRFLYQFFKILSHLCFLIQSNVCFGIHTMYLSCVLTGSVKLEIILKLLGAVFMLLRGIKYFYYFIVNIIVIKFIFRCWNLAFKCMYEKLESLHILRKYFTKKRQIQILLIQLT